MSKLSELMVENRQLKKNAWAWEHSAKSKQREIARLENCIKVQDSVAAGIQKIVVENRQLHKDVQRQMARVKEQDGVIAALRKTAVENVELRERTQKLEGVLWLYVRYEEDASQCPNCCEEGDLCIYRTAKALLEATDSRRED